MIVSGVITVGILLLAFFFCKTDKSKSIAIKFFAVITVILHYSTLWVDYLTTGVAIAEPPMLFPIYPCNICMWLLLISAFIKRRNNFAYRTLTEFTFWAGCVCGFIGILFNEHYAANPNLLDYHVLKGLLSHSTMIVGAAMLAVLGIVKIRIKNVLSVAIGLTFFIIDGAAINALYAHFELPPCNAMYLLEAPFSSLPWLGTTTVGLMALATALILSALYEQIFVPKSERWYMLIKRGKKSS